MRLISGGITHPYTNKIVQCATDFGRVKNVVLTDVDVAFAARAPFDYFRGVVAGKPVDMGNPSLEVLTKIFKFAGIRPLGVCRNQYVSNESTHVFETFIGNFNGGLYIIPVEHMGEIGGRWSFWASWLISNIHLLELWHLNVDQVAFCLAISELNMMPIVLGNCWNFPTHISLPPIDAAPWLVHHHARLNSQQDLISVADAVANMSIEKINSSVRGFRRALNLKTI